MRLLVRQLDVEADRGRRRPRCAPRLAASMIPGPPPVMIAKPASPSLRASLARVLVLAGGRAACGRSRRSRPPCRRARARAKPSRSSSWMRCSRCASVSSERIVDGLGLEQLLVERLGAPEVVIGIGRPPGQGRAGARAAAGRVGRTHERARLHAPRRRRAPPAAARARRGPVRPPQLRRALDGRDRARGRRSPRRCCTTTSRASRPTSAPRSQQGAAELAARRRRRRAAGRAARRLPRLGRGCTASAYAKLVRSAAASPEVRELIDARARRHRPADPRRPPRRGRRPSAAPRCARGCGSWTARSSTGSSTATSTARQLRALLLRALEGALGEPL